MTDTETPASHVTDRDPTYEQGLKDGEDRERLRIMALARDIGRELAENGKTLYEKHGDYLEGRIREHVGGALEGDLAALVEQIRAAGAETPEIKELQEMLRRPTRWQPGDDDGDK